MKIEFIEENDGQFPVIVEDKNGRLFFMLGERGNDVRGFSLNQEIDAPYKNFELFPYFAPIKRSAGNFIPDDHWVKFYKPVFRK